MGLTQNEVSIIVLAKPAERLWRRNFREFEEVSKEVIRNIACLAILLGAAVGCGPKTDRLPISGKVTLDGVPLETGSISFASMPGEKLQSTGAMIQNGSYSIPAEKGLLPGVYGLQLTSPDAEAKPILLRDAASGRSFPVAPDRIPAEYNVDSTKTIEVTRDGDNVFDFNISNASK